MKTLNNIWDFMVYWDLSENGHYICQAITVAFWVVIIATSVDFRKYNGTLISTIMGISSVLYAYWILIQYIKNNHSFSWLQPESYIFNWGVCITLYLLSRKSYIDYSKRKQILLT